MRRGVSAAFVCWGGCRSLSTLFLLPADFGEVLYTKALEDTVSNSSADTGQGMDILGYTGIYWDILGGGEGPLQPFGGQAHPAGMMEMYTGTVAYWEGGTARPPWVLGTW